MKLTEHFSLDELTASDTALRLGIDNTPAPKILDRLGVTASGLETVRDLLGAPMYVTSGYRCLELNTVIGGSHHSAHMDGWAADFICPKFGSPFEIVRAIAASSIDFDQCIQEGRWVHISFAPARRRDVLTAHFSGGSVTYTAGVGLA